MLDDGCAAVLVKGGHLRSAPATDILLCGEGSEEMFEGRFIDTPGARGTGCTLAAAIAVHLGRGRSLPCAIGRAKRYVAAAIERAPGPALADGARPLEHFPAEARRDGTMTPTP